MTEAPKGFRAVEYILNIHQKQGGKPTLLSLLDCRNEGYRRQG